MKLNEKGFVFPLTLMILLFISLVLMIQLQKWMNEKYFFYEVETFEKNQFVLLQTLKLVEEELKIGNRGDGQIFLSGYAASYKISEEEDHLLKIELILISEKGRSVTAWAWFDVNTMETVKWLERN